MKHVKPNKNLKLKWAFGPLIDTVPAASASSSEAISRGLGEQADWSDRPRVEIAISGRGLDYSPLRC